VGKEGRRGEEKSQLSSVRFSPPALPNPKTELSKKKKNLLLLGVVLLTKMTLLPYISLNGAQTSGPAPNPRT